MVSILLVSPRPGHDVATAERKDVLRATGLAPERLEQVLVDDVEKYLPDFLASMASSSVEVHLISALKHIRIGKNMSIPSYLALSTLLFHHFLFAMEIHFSSI